MSGNLLKVWILNNNDRGGEIFTQLFVEESFCREDMIRLGESICEEAELDINDEDVVSITDQSYYADGICDLRMDWAYVQGSECL